METKHLIHNVHLLLVLAFMSLWGLDVWSQTVPVTYSYNDGVITMTIFKERDSLKLDSICVSVGHDYKELDRLTQLGLPQPTTTGWILDESNQDVYRLHKEISKLNSAGKKVHSIWDIDLEDTEIKTTKLIATYGVNEVKRDAIKQIEKGLLFEFRNGKKARKVVLSGNFNDWTTSSANVSYNQFLEKWTANVELNPGKYWYKYIVDGKWTLDPDNKLKEYDAQGNENNICYKTNYQFELKGYLNAKRVYVAGNFNNWREKELRLQRMKTGWFLPIYLREGTYTYKFIVDNEWIIDPDNTQTRDDGSGNLNSVISIGDTIFFSLMGYKEAQEVFIAGDFNDWRYGELKMNRTEKGWRLPYVLPPGNHRYKFIINGSWTADPDNPVTEGTDEFINSVKVVEPNHTFYLKGYINAQEVFASGSFNGWSESGYRMEKTSDGWKLDVYLYPGKVLYKFKVDGTWIIDSENPLYENNEYGTGNSILWIE
jgi:hypothetical protein